MPLIDTHVHLHFPDFEKDQSAVLERALDAGVGAFINVGTDLQSSRVSLQLAEKHPKIFAAAGIHPHDAQKAQASDIEDIEKLMAHPRVVAIGEVGLDFFRDHSPREAQEKMLVPFLQMHQRTGKPLILHCRDAYDRLLEMLQQEVGKVVKGVMHCYSSDSTMMKKFLDLGLYISFAGPLTYKKNESLREACKRCPENRLLLETDAPFLPPQSRRGRRNEPAFMKETAETAAKVRGISLDVLEDIEGTNARKLFSL